MRLATCVIAAAVGLVLATPARADEAAASQQYRAVIDRVDLEPATFGGTRLRIKLSALSMQSQLIELAGPKSIKVQLGSSKLDAPIAIGPYRATDADTAIVFVIEANAAFAEVLPKLLGALDATVLQSLGDRTQVAFLAYSEATGTGKLSSLKSARNRLDAVTADTAAAEPALLDTLDRALLLLKRAKTSPVRPLRKLVVVVGDGRDRAVDRERVTNLGVRADREGVRIHSFGYAPSKLLRPLLVLGELSRKSQGTFRWVRSGGAESWTPAFQQLADEINKQYVITAFLPSDTDAAGKKVRVTVTVGALDVVSNDAKVPNEPSCGGAACDGYCADGICAAPLPPAGRGVGGWVLIIGGVVIGGIVLLGGIGFLLQRRQSVPMPPPGQFPPGFVPPPGFVLPPGSVPPGSVPPGSVPPGSVPPPKQKKSKPPKNQPSQPPAAVAPPAPIAGPSLMFLTGPNAGQRVALGHGFSIGKAPNSSLVIDDGYTSSNHAQIGMDHFGNCRLYDRGSTNGTFVNGVRVTELALEHGAAIRIGSTELRFLAQ